MGISRRKYAEHRGVTENAVRKAIAAGRIRVEADGSIDPAKADAERGAHSHRQGARTAAETAASPPMKPVPRTAIRAVDETLRDSGEGEAGQTSFMRARMGNEVLKAQIARERLKEMKGESVDRARAVALVFDLARRERDASVNWPPRVAANMAADLGVDAHLMEQVLESYLSRHRPDMAEVKIELRRRLRGRREPAPRLVAGARKRENSLPAGPEN